MSSSITKNSTIVNDNSDKDKNNTINTFSRNFTKSYMGLKYGNIYYNNSKNNESNNYNNKPNKTIQNNIIISNKNNNNKNIKLNSFAEIEYQFNDSQIKDSNIKFNNNLPEKNIINKNNDNNINKKNKVKKIYNILSNNNSNLNLKNNTYINKNILYKNNNNNIKLGLNNKKLKKNLSNFNSFFKRLSYYQKEREKNMNVLRNRTFEKENSQMKNKPEISKYSILLSKTIKREPLYAKKPLNEEKNLDNNFQKFYNKNMSENNDNIIIINSNKNNNKKIEEKYDKFYEDNINWKKNLEEKNNEKRNKNKKIDEEIIGKYSFTPILNKKSIYIVDKLNRDSTIDYDVNNNFYYYDNKKELLDRLKLRLKPIISDISENRINRPYINTKSTLLKRTLSDLNITKRFNNNKTTKNKEYKINYKVNKKKYELSKNEKIKEEKKPKKNKNKKSEENYLLQKLKEIKKENENKKKELYKLNIRQGGAWNEEVLNNVIPMKKCGHIIEGLL